MMLLVLLPMWIKNLISLGIPADSDVNFKLGSHDKLVENVPNPLNLHCKTCNESLIVEYEHILELATG